MIRVSESAAPDPGYQRFDCTGSDPEAIAQAAEAARVAVEQGDCIVFPTDTVYGIGADAFSAEAVQRLLDAKIRGRDMPPPVLIAEASLLRALAVDVPEAAKTLVAWYWPGPVTVICKAQPSLHMDLGETGGTIALRVPNHELAREILRKTGPLAVSSANISGMPAATTCDEAIDQLADRVSVYLDGGPLGTDGVALPSTIVDFTQVPGGAILRRGALSVEQIRDVCPDVVDLDEDADTLGASGASPEPVPDEADEATEGTASASSDSEAGSSPAADSEAGASAGPDSEAGASTGPDSEAGASAGPDSEAGASTAVGSEGSGSRSPDADTPQSEAGRSTEPDAAHQPMADTGR
jgi:L-threonylcarbamoyladenylate synthase